MDNLISIEKLSAEDLNLILDRAQHYLSHRPEPKLSGKTLFNLFFENSTRTRVSFELAAKRLGMDVINMSETGSSVKKGETLSDTLLTLNAMHPDAVVIRHSDEGSAKLATEIFDCPVLNAGDGKNEHPTQALLDCLAARQHFPDFKNLKIAIAGDLKHSRVARSSSLAFAKLGATVTMIAPEAFQPQNGNWDHVTMTTSMEEGLKDQNIVMMLRIQKERFIDVDEENALDHYILDHEKIALAAPDALVMHPGPMNRGVEISSELADDPKRSLILKQVECGVAVRMAVLDLLLGG